MSSGSVSVWSGVPSKSTSPSVGWSRPTMSLSSTVLPQPLSPITQSVSCGANREIDSGEHLLPAEPHANAAKLDDGSVGHSKSQTERG